MDPDPAFYLNGDPDLDPGSQIYVDLVGLSYRFIYSYFVYFKSIGNISAIAVRIHADSGEQNQCGSMWIRIRNRNTGNIIE
jgi:hypothetical protein